MAEKSPKPDVADIEEEKKPEEKPKEKEIKKEEPGVVKPEIKPIKPVERPTLEKAKKSAWWRRLFGGEPVGEAEEAVAGAREGVEEAVRARRLGVDIAEEAVDLNRIVRPEIMRQPQDASELVALIDQLDSNSFRQRKLREKYGEGNIGVIKQFLAGESEYSYNPRGEVEHNWLTELGRRAASIITDRRIVIGGLSMAAIGIITGGVGAVAMAGFWGGVFGKVAGEAYEAAYGKERKLRGQIAQRHYEQFEDLKKLAAEVRSAETDADRVKQLNLLIDKFYSQDSQIVEDEAKILADKIQFDKIKGYLITAGNIIGIGSALSGSFSQISSAGVERIKMYDFDGDNVYHSIVDTNYDIRNAQNVITGTHTLGGTPTEEMLNNFIYKDIVDESAKRTILTAVGADIAKGVGVGAAMGLANFIKMPAYERGEYNTTLEDLARARARIEKDVPATATVEEEKTVEKEIKTGQIWVFDFMNTIGLDKMTNPNIYADFMNENTIEITDPKNPDSPNKLFFGSYRVEKIEGDNVTIALMDPARLNVVCKDADGKQITYTISKKDLAEYASLDNIKNEERKYDIIFNQFAEKQNKPMPKENFIWKFNEGMYDNVFGGESVELPTGVKRFRIIQIKNNFVYMEPLEDDKNVRVKDGKEFRLHMLHLIKYGEPERTKALVEADKKILERKDIDPAKPEGEFMSPDGAKDIYGKDISANKKFKIVKVDLENGLATLEAIEEIKIGKVKEKPKYIINIIDLENGWREQSMPKKKEESEEEKKEDDEKEEKSLMDKFLDLLVKKGVIEKGEKEKVKKLSVFLFDGKYWAFSSVRKDQVVLIQVEEKPDKKGLYYKLGTIREMKKWNEFADGAEFIGKSAR